MDGEKMKDLDVLAIVGPTASGKTAISIKLAKFLNGEIINGDSMQVYKGLDIGTAKITQSEMEEIPHAGVGIIIISGAWLIGKQDKNKIDNKIAKPADQKTENYYDVLEKKCAGDSCCLDSLKIMRKNNYKEADKNGKCPEGFYKDMRYCKNLLQWCVPIEESYCIDEQDNRRELGEIFSESPTMFMKCNRFGNVSNYHILSCGSEKLVISEGLEGFGVVSRKAPSESFSIGSEGTLGFTWTINDKKYLTFSGGPGSFFVACDKEKAAIFYSHLVEMGSNDYMYEKRFFDGNSVAEISCSYRKEIPDNFVISKFEDGKRVYNFKPLKNGKEICQEIKERYQELKETVVETSNWQTYHDKKNGFEIKYQSSQKPSTNGNYAAGSVSFEIEGENSKHLGYSHFEIIAYENNKEFSAKEFAENYKRNVWKINKDYLSGVNIIKQETQINDYDAYFYDGVTGSKRGDTAKVYFITHKNKAVSISFTSSAPDYDMYDNLKICNKMLSTLKFTEN